MIQGSDVSGHKHADAFKAEASHAASDDRILQGKRIERHDGSGDRQRCRPPFCILGLADVRQGSAGTWPIGCRAGSSQ